MFSSSIKILRRPKCKMWKKWQLFHATDFQSLMYPCFTFCSIIGIFPYKINGSTFETSKQRYILSTIIICALVIYDLVMLYDIDIVKNDFQGVPKTLERNCFLILSKFIAIVTYILRGPRMHLLQTIMNISSKLPHNSYQKLSRLIHTKDIFGFFFLVVPMTCHCAKLNVHKWNKKAFIPYNFLLVFQMDMLYINCVCILKACFKRIDDNLINLREFIVSDDSHSLRQIYHKHRNPCLLMELKALKKQHLAISDTVQMLNTIFSLQLLATIVMTFTELTFQLYFLIMHWKIDMIVNNWSGNNSYYLFLITIFMTFYFIKLMLIVWACDTGKDQAMKIGATVHDMLNNTSDEQIETELQLFSLQILHRENAFSAKGLIVDTNLLTAIVGNITTYLVILIQFLIATPCNDNIVTNNVTQIIKLKKEI